jgi:radical SAM superfamily enzyme YgiQ (UPF0313 family)
MRIKLAFLGPTLDETVNEVSMPVSWAEYLENFCEVRGRSQWATWYAGVNTNYIVFRGRVLVNYGFNGRVLFDKLNNTRERKKWLRTVRNQMNDLWLMGYRPKNR